MVALSDLSDSSGKPSPSRRGYVDLFIELVIRYNQGAPLSAAELELLELGLQEPLCLEALDKQMDLELSALEKEDIDIESLSDAFKEEALQRFLQKLNALHKSRGLERPATNSQTSLTSSELNDPNEQNNLDQQAGEMGSQDSNTGKKKDHKLLAGLCRGSDRWYTTLI